MKRAIQILCLAFVIVLALGAVALAHTGSPCNDSGEPGNSDYAQHHIRPQAQDGDIGAVDHDGDSSAHYPGAHQGYSTCN